VEFAPLSIFSRTDYSRGIEPVRIEQDMFERQWWGDRRKVKKPHMNVPGNHKFPGLNEFVAPN
jgi:hypothetical protein